MEPLAAAASTRLGSWKEIAAYFGKDARTVRRWEQDRGLPVHRVPGGGRSTVYAYAAELEAWLAEPPAVQEVGAVAAFGELTLHAAATTNQITDDHSTQPALPHAHPAEQLRLVWPRLPLSLLPSVRGALRPSSGWLIAALALLTAALGGVATVMHRASTPRPVLPSSARVAPDPATRDLYLRGRFLWNQRTEDSLTRAAALFDQAATRDPQYAPARAGLADTYLLLRQYGKMSDAEAYTRAYYASRRALEIDPSSVEAHRAYAFVLNFWLWNFPAAEKEFRHAIELDPNDAQTHHWYATSLLSAGRPQDALREIEIARQLQPDSVVILANRGFILRNIDPALAVSSLLDIEHTNPAFAYVHRYLAFLRFDARQNQDFLDEFRTYFVLQQRDPEVAAMDRARVQLVRHGEQAMLQTLAQQLGTLAETPGSQESMDAAMIYARLHEERQTLHYLALSCKRRESGCAVLPTAKEYGFLRGIPAYEAMLVQSRTPIEAPPLAGQPLSSLAIR